MAINLSEFKGSYALITGASSGLGLAFAEELARVGMNLVLVARDQQRLFTIAKEIEQKFQVVTLPIPLDLSAVSAAEELHLQINTKKIKIRLLCNNVASGYLGDFNTAPLIEIQKMLQLNQTAMVSLSHLFLGDLSTHSKSAVINVSSAAAFQPIPYMAVYGASKAFVHSFSLALHWEWKEKGVYVQTLTPGAIDTEFNNKIGFDIKKMKNVKTAAEVALLSLQGFKKEEVVVKATKGIFLQKFFANFFPPQIVLKTVGEMFKPTGK